MVRRDSAMQKRLRDYVRRFCIALSRRTIGSPRLCAGSCGVFCYPLPLPGVLGLALFDAGEVGAH